ncbi:MAG: glycosyltransferase [Lachnospiraceae bacterium]|nr:glycosyltransferase [Lachnospiraceae bacterium]MBQ9605580.1 glycosyltransferase [Lachnospiraceae bacterium]MBR1524647.1 glycosyltransferase [Lachnospiraceae bacterium]
MRTAVLIPCYNEAKTIKTVVEDFRSTLPDADIYVYDNNSTDGTDDIAREAGAIVRYEVRQGKGNVIRTMFREIDADCYIMADGDNTYPASFAPKLQRLVLDGKADMVIGDRLSSSYFTENKRRFHGFGNRLVRSLINHLFHAKINDIMTGARAFSRDFVKSFAVSSKGFEIETEMTIFALENNFRIMEVPIEYKDRDADNPSKLSTYSDGYKVLKTIFRLLRDDKPTVFFGAIGIVTILIGVALFIPIVIEFSRTGEVPRYPTLIVLTALWVIGIVSIFSGVILSLINARSKQEFERFMNLMYICDGREIRGNVRKKGTRAWQKSTERGYWKGWDE